MTLDEFNEKYVYTKDAHEAWTECKEKGSFLLGDCEDYCLTLLKDVVGFEKGELYYCKLKGRGHCVLKVGNWYIDCNRRRLVDKPFLQELGYTDFRKYWAIEIWYYKITTKIFGRVPFL